MFIYDLAPGELVAVPLRMTTRSALLVVDGTVVVRTPDGEHTVERGELVRFPAGPDRGAQGHEPQRCACQDVAVLARGLGYAVSVYPDSDTIGVWAGGENDLVFERSNAVPWAHGEEGWQNRLTPVRSRPLGLR